MATDGRARRPVVMVVVGNAGLRGAIREFVADKRPECVVLEAISGEEALAKVAARQVDVALVDLRLPGIGGVETARRMKSSAPGTRIAVLTDHDDTLNLITESSSGTASIWKGALVEHLDRLLSAFLSAQPASAATPVRRGEQRRRGERRVRTP